MEGSLSGQGNDPMLGQGRVRLRVPWVPLFLIAVSIGGWAYARPFPGESRVLPQAVSLAIGVLAAFLAFTEVIGSGYKLRKVRGGDEAPSSAPSSRTQQILAFVLVGGFAVATYLVGIFVSSALVLLFGMRLLGSRWTEAAWITGVTMLALYVLFVRLLGLPIYWGLFS